MDILTGNGEADTFGTESQGIHRIHPNTMITIGGHGECHPVSKGYTPSQDNFQQPPAKFIEVNSMFPSSFMDFYGDLPFKSMKSLRSADPWL